jgi:hypothetical protein
MSARSKLFRIVAFLTAMVIFSGIVYTGVEEFGAYFAVPAMASALLACWIYGRPGEKSSDANLPTAPAFGGRCSALDIGCDPRMRRVI